jgi:hypothetical protein
MRFVSTVLLSSIPISIVGLAILRVVEGPFYYPYLVTLIFVFPVVLGYQLIVCLIDTLVSKRYSPNPIVRITFLILLYAVMITVNVVAAYSSELSIAQMWIMIRHHLLFEIPVATVATVMISRIVNRYFDREVGDDIIGKY